MDDPCGIATSSEATTWATAAKGHAEEGWATEHAGSQKSSTKLNGPNDDAEDNCGVKYQKNTIYRINKKLFKGINKKTNYLIKK